MAILSNLNESSQARYTIYIQNRYSPLIHSKTLGHQVQPVIQTNQVERLFGIHIGHVPQIEAAGAYEAYCDVEGPVVNWEQIEEIVYKNMLTSRKTFVDLKVAFLLYKYDLYMSDRLVLLADDMYNASQLHNEFIECVINYLKGNIQDSMTADFTNYSIDANPQSGIDYKELMDYFHYHGEKPDVSFKIVYRGKSGKYILKKEDYDGSFTETSYNLCIRALTAL